MPERPSIPIDLRVHCGDCDRSYQMNLGLGSSGPEKNIPRRVFKHEISFWYSWGRCVSGQKNKPCQCQEVPEGYLLLEMPKGFLKRQGGGLGGL